jgi:exosortase
VTFREDLVEVRQIIPPSATWRFLVLSCLVLLLFGPTLWNLMGTWNTDQDYSHGFFVIPIALFMVWHKRDRIAAVTVHPSWTGLPLFLAGAFLYVIAFVSRFHTLTHVSMILMLLGLILFLGGYGLTRQLILPVAFLIFMFPIPNAYYIMITNPLKLLITSISATLLRGLGIPVYQEGNLLFFAKAQIEVAEACSGIRSLYSYLMVGCLFALMSRGRLQKAVMILSAFPLAILVNIIRVSGTGILANIYGEAVAQGFFHQFAGFALFIVGLIALSLEYYLLQILSQRSSGQNP